MFKKGFIILAISVVLSLTTSLLLNSYYKTYNKDWWISLTVYSSIFLVLHFLYFVKTDGKSYTGLLLGMITVKLLILLIFIFLYSLLRSDSLSTFTIHFFSHYILFTLFEIRYLLQVVKLKKHHQNE